LTPADFFLFGYVNEKIRGQEFLSAQSVVAAYKDGVNFVAKKTWQSTFNNCYDQWRSNPKCRLGPIRLNAALYFNKKVGSIFTK